MNCKQCPHSTNGKAGLSCLLNGKVSSTYAGGCDLVATRQADAENEKRRVDSLPDVPIRNPKAEKELQAQCEGLLTARGYRRMTAPEAEAAIKPDAITRGWFFHLHKPLGNPLCPDLIVFDSTMTHCLCVELKTRLVYQPGQSEMIRFGAWYLAENFFDFVALLDNWSGHKLDGHK